MIKCKTSNVHQQKYVLKADIIEGGGVWGAICRKVVNEIWFNIRNESFATKDFKKAQKLFFAMLQISIKKRWMALKMQFARQ